MPTYYSANGEGDLNNVYLHNYEEYLITDTFVTSGRLWGWGYNVNGQLGDNSITGKSSPVQTVSGGTNWKQISVAGAGATGSGSFVGAIKTDGSLWLWGAGGQGNLGDNTRTDKSSPVQTVSGGTDWRQVDVSGSHTAAIKTDGSLWLWGSNGQGQLGDNSSAAKSSPVQTVSGGTDWRSVSCGGANSSDDFTAAIKTDGTLWTWGGNGFGGLGDNTTTNRSSPVQTVAGGTNWKQVSCGSRHTGAIKTDGTLWTWGNNTIGQLGDNSSAAKSSPVQTVAGGTNWKFVNCGYHHTAAIKTDGTLWLWGGNGGGALGDNSSTSKSSPVQTVSGGTDWKDVSCGGTAGSNTSGHTAAIKTDNSLWTWGHNDAGQLGTNNTTSISSPVQTVAGGTIWRQVSAGGPVTGAVTF